MSRLRNWWSTTFLARITRGEWLTYALLTVIYMIASSFVCATMTAKAVFCAIGAMQGMFIYSIQQRIERENDAAALGGQ